MLSYCIGIERDGALLFERFHDGFYVRMLSDYQRLAVACQLMLVALHMFNGQGDLYYVFF